MSLIIKKNTTFKIPRTGSFLPSSLAGLSLWLKADAGVTTFSYSYKSNITLSLAGESSINGSYTASDPGNGTSSYIMSGPNNHRIEVRPNSTPRYRLYKSDYSTYNNPWFYSFTSSDGVTWTAFGKKPVSITLSGLTGVSSASNGTYNSFEWDPGNQSFVSPKSVVGGVDTNILVEIYPSGQAGAYILSPTFFVSAQKSTGWGIGSWTIEEGTGSPVGTGTLYPTGGVPIGVVTTTTVNTDNVTEWADQSGNGIVLTPDIQNAPTLVSSFLNGKPAIEFIVDNNTGLSNTSFGLTGFTFFSVTKQKSTNTGRIFSSYFDNVLIGTWGIYSNRFYGGEDNGWLAEGEQTSTDFLITTAFSDADTSFDFSQNGVSQSSGASNSTVILNGISVGGGVWNGGNEEASDSYVCEIVIYNRTLTLTERQQVEAYLNQKYAIY